MNKIEPFVNTQLLELVRQARETVIDPAEIDDREPEKARHYSELYRIVSNYDDDEMIVCVAAILEKNSKVIHQTMEAERQSLRKGKSNDRNSKQ